MTLWSKVYHLTGIIATDMLEAIGYLPWGILAGFIFILLWSVWNKAYQRQKELISGEKKWILFLCVIYSTVLLNLVFFSREPGSRKGLDLRLFETLGTDLQSQSYFIENIFVFLPFGILFPLAFVKLRKGRLCIAIGLLTSIFVEVLQLFTQRGYCQLDDVLTNTIGVIIGWSIHAIGIRLSHYRSLSAHLDRTV